MHWPVVVFVDEVVVFVLVVAVVVVVVEVVEVVVVVVEGHSGEQRLQNHCWQAGYQPPA